VDCVHYTGKAKVVEHVSANVTNGIAYVIQSPSAIAKPKTQTLYSSRKLVLCSGNYPSLTNNSLHPTLSIHLQK
jgi:hypothetical protein